MTKTCVICGKEFTPYHTADRFCSRECNLRDKVIRKRKHGEVERVCPICGKRFITAIPQKKTCSKECAKVFRSRPRKKHLTEEQIEKKRIKDRERYLREHPNARTQADISAESKRKQLERQEKRLRRKAELEKQRQKAREEKERIRQENIAYWREYEAEHTCVECGKKFIAYHPLTKYCSEACNRRAHKTKKRYEGITIDKGITLKRLAKRDGNICQLCGLFVDWSDFEKTDKTTVCGDMYPSIDHITPISLGGLHSWDNVQLAHRGCNTKKRNRFVG